MMRFRGVSGVLLGALLAPAVAAAQSLIFDSAFTEPGGGRLTDVAVADIDGDEAATNDVVATRENNDVAFFLNDFNEGSVFLDPVNTIFTGSFPAGLVLANFDEDPDDIADLVVANANSGDVVFLRGLKNDSYFDFPGDPISLADTPRAVAAADVDRDGHLDVVVGNQGVAGSAPGSMSVLRGAGDGTFTKVLQPDPNEPGEFLEGLPAGLDTQAVAVGRVDGDDNVDAVVVNAGSNSATLFRGNGNGTFQAGQSISVGGEPKDLALADLNGDLLLDLVTADRFDDAVSVLLGNGDGTFGQRESHRVGAFPTAVAVGDVDGDGVNDIVASNEGSFDVSVLIGDGAGGFAAARGYVTAPEPRGVALGNMNDDDRLDIVAIHAEDVAVVRNRGDGSYVAVENLLVGRAPSAVKAADVDNDGRPDLVVATEAGRILSFRSLGEHRFAAPITLEAGGRPRALVVVDLDRDDRADVEVADNEGSIAIARGLGGGAFGAFTRIATGDDPAGIAAGDFNGDGRLDLAVSIVGPPGRVAASLQQADGTFAATVDSAVGDTPLGIAAEDGDGDGRDDLVVGNEASDSVTVLRSLGDGFFAVRQTLTREQVGQGPLSVDTADFNRDGRVDFALGLAVSPGADPSVRVFSGNGDGTFTFTSSVRAGDFVSAVVARDFTNDRIIDLGVINQTSNAIRVLQGTGSGQFSSRVPDQVSRMPITLAAGDFDDDGRYDAVSGNNAELSNNASLLWNCIGNDDCRSTGEPFPLRGDANDDGVTTAADLVVVARIVIDANGTRVEEIGLEQFSGDTDAAPGVDANGDGLVNAQDRVAMARRIFGG